MHQKLAKIDIFNNAQIIFDRKLESKIYIWVIVLIVISGLFIFISLFYRYETYDIYYGKVVNDTEDNYLTFTVGEDFISKKNRNYLIINDEDIKCHLLKMSDNYYLIDGSKYWDVFFECELGQELNFNSNVLEVKIDNGSTTLYQYFIAKLRKVVKSGRIKN